MRLISSSISIYFYQVVEALVMKEEEDGVVMMAMEVEEG